MVYESDFYTTRRPYSSRPVVSSYSVTSPSFRIYSSTIPSVSRVHTTTTRSYTSSYPIYTSYPTVYRTVRTSTVPFIAHKRLVTGTRITTTPSRVYRATPTRVITSPIRLISVRVRPSVLNREYKRIENKVRTHPHYYATEHYLNSLDSKTFDDEARDIRNASNALLRKVHTRVERAHSVSPVSYTSKYEQRYGPDSFVSRMVGPLDLDDIQRYNPNRYIGKSHLASVRIVGNKAYDRRRATSHFDDDKVRNDVNLLSYYLKNRKAAAEKQEPKVVLESAKLDPFRPSRKFAEIKNYEFQEEDDEMKDKQRARLERLNALADEVIDEIDLEKRKAQRLEATKQREEKALLEEIEKKAEKARREEKERQDKLAAEAAAERAAELERKAAEEARLAEEGARAAEARAAEEAKRAEEAKLAEEARLIEEARLAEEARVAEEARIAEEAKQAEEARIAEDARLAEEAKQAEEARIAEEARLADEARREEEAKMREGELARLAELERIAVEEEEAEIARQAAELSEIARQQEAEAQREAEELEAQSAASEAEHTVSEQPESASEQAAAEDTADEETLHEDEPADEPVVEEPQSPVDDPAEATKTETEGDLTEEEE